MYMYVIRWVDIFMDMKIYDLKMADVVGDPQVELAIEQSRLERERLARRSGRRKCCQCNGNGSCIRCECATSQRRCSNCLPSRRLRCSNSSPAPASELSVTECGESSAPSASAPGPCRPRPVAAAKEVSVACSVSNASSSSPPLGMTLDTRALAMSSQPLVGSSLPSSSECHRSAVADVSAATTSIRSALDSASSSCPPVLGIDNASPPREPVSSPPSTTALPPFSPCSSTSFRWGDVDGDQFCADIAKVYEEQIHWRKNIFSPPSGHAGMDYVREHTRLMSAYMNKTPLERVALQAVLVMPGLLLQKPHAKAGSKEFGKHLARRLVLWKAGRIMELLVEARTIQSRLPEWDKQSGTTTERLNRRFAFLIGRGDIHAAISLITEHGKGGVLELTPEVRSGLLAKHPPAQPADPGVLIHGEQPVVDPILFEELTGDVVRKAALATQGAAGPSMGDSYVWRRMLVSFKAASRDLCDSIAGVARRLATAHVDPAGLLCLLNNRLVPLDKDPGVRPVGVGEVLRRIIGKSVLTVVKKDVMLAAGAAQVCAGQAAGCEAAIHALRQVFEAVGTDGVLLVDADNAFNRLNRAVALHNIRYICPALATTVINFYRLPARLFVTGGMELSSQEGTTQGCPLSMALYALSVVPLIDTCRDTASDGCSAATQTWYADDAAAGGRLKNLRLFWDLLVQHGPSYGYFPKPAKTFLVVKPELHAEAVRVFADTGVQLTLDGPDLVHKAGQRHLGAAVGSSEFVAAYLNKKVATWAAQVDRLADVAATQPHAAYAAFVFALRHRWTFIQRTMPTAGNHMQPLQDSIRHKLIPAVTKHQPNDLELELLSLPAAYGGMTFDDPVADSQRKHADSIKCTANLAGLIRTGEPHLPSTVDPDRAAKATVRRRRQMDLTVIADALQDRLPDPQRRAMMLARQKGVSSTLTTIPVAEHGFFFDVKSDFHDHVHLRYCWPIDNLPASCACGARYSIHHAQICKLAGFVHMRHDDTTDFLAKCLKEVHNDVEVEPPLLPLSGETFRCRSTNTQPDARADIRVRGFWTDSRNAFFDTRVFYPHAQSYQSRSLPSLFKSFESAKKREYGERVSEVEHGSFTPLVFSACGGMGAEASVVIKRLAASLAVKRNESYSRVVSWIRSCLAYALARSAIRCIRGSRSLRRRVLELAPVDLVHSEARFGPA